MIDFPTLKGLTIPEGVVTQIADASGRVLWALSGGKVILQVTKVTATTKAGETTYSDEQFVLIDIYPKTNGTVKVTYGGLTKTITDTSGAAEPNAQQVFFGTFNGVSDSVETPASGELTIEGDCYAFATGQYTNDKPTSSTSGCIINILDFGNVKEIPARAFHRVVYAAGGNGLTGELVISSKIKSIGKGAFLGNEHLTRVIFESPLGWYATETEGATSGTELDLTNPENNVGLLFRDTDNTETSNLACYWYQS